MASEEQLSAEREAGKRTAVFAFVAAAFGLAAGFVPVLMPGILGVSLLSDFPNNSSSRVLFFDHNSTKLLLLTACSLVALLTLGAVLRQLYLVTKARNPQFNRAALVCLLVGVVLVSVGSLAHQILLTTQAADFAKNGNQTYAEAKDILTSPGVVASAAALQAGLLALAIALVMIAINAMRVGLLTRFMGILGVICAVLLVIPLSPVPVVQAFWLGALGYLLLGRWPKGLPPAWESGEARPWPSLQRLREQP